MTPTMSTTPSSIISQELFDETILENEECFDLSPPEALHETITQFCQQLGYNTVPLVVVDCNNDNGNNNDNDSNDEEVSSSRVVKSYDRTQLPPFMTHLSLTHPNYNTNNNTNNNDERIEMVKFNEALSLLDSCVGDADGRLLLSFHHDDDNNNGENNDDGKSDNNNNVTAAVLLNTFYYLSNQLSSSTKHDDDDALLRYLTVFQQSSAIYTLMSFLRIIQQHQQQQQQQQQREEEVDRLLILNGVVQTLSTILTATTTAATSSSSSTANTATVVAKRQRIIHQTNNIRNNLRDLFIPALGSLVVNLLFHFQQQQLVMTTTVSSDQQEEEEQQLQKKILLHLLKLSINSTRGCEGGKVAFVQSSIPPQIVGKQTVLTKRGGVQILFYILSSSVYVDSNTTNGSSGGDNSGSNDNEETTMNNLQTTEAACQLLSTLCRFDDFRTPSSSTTTTNNNSATVTDSSAGTTSSAHDHAMEFHRVNVELLLMKIARGVLNDLSTGVGCGDDTSGSGGGSDSDDKVAGVLERKEMLAASVLTALRVLAVNDEIIQTMVALGVLPIVTNALQLGVAAVAAASDDKSSSTSSIKNEEATTTTTTINSTTRSSTLLRKHRLTAASLGLLRNLCGNDEIKTNLCLGSTNTNSDDDNHQSLSALSISSTPSALPHLLHAMERYPTISPIQEHACGTLAAMALRRPVNALTIIDAGGPRLIITAMKRHDEVVSVQRQGALAIRNIVSRILKDLDGSAGAGNATSLEDARSEIRDRFHELGVEDVLRNITGRHQGSVDEAYAALRDLGYSVSLTKFNAEDLQDGANQVGAVSRTMMFGEKHNSNFRPVYDESAGLNNAVYDAMSKST